MFNRILKACFKGSILDLMGYANFSFHQLLSFVTQLSIYFIVIKQILIYTTNINIFLKNFEGIANFRGGLTTRVWGDKIYMTKIQHVL